MIAPARRATVGREGFTSSSAMRHVTPILVSVTPEYLSLPHVAAVPGPAEA